MQNISLCDEIIIKEETLEETILEESSSPADNDVENYPEHFSESDNYMVNPIELEEDLVDVFQPWDSDDVEIIPVESPKTVDLTDNETESRPKSPKSMTPPLPELEKINELKRKSVDTPSINQNGGTEQPATKKVKMSDSSTSLNQSVNAQSQTDCPKGTVVNKKSKQSKPSISPQSSTDFESFGKFVADQLQRIPLNRALRAQLTITTILTELRVLSAEESSSQMLSSDDDK